ncbi:hypothetical protein A9264_10700 [Vibrio sp. UCD-FRSSP16_10]|uniref:DUF2780 domain-containing protein n=1 Tax=unclassified Vibrio TaxID=2614977 RepID=UPI0007FD88C8|nr:MULTISPECIES: DUF2780 domain-containing protein [unclassified Vibrio]OBT16733.1 hypothetical protein A9260_10920 [Vibrio sp. UCD-FRSSP16_30]OBT21360.1 hypothetical protein A9264_10700 [Vibrio sp. UCD-FRSSP16_10]
MKGIAATTLIGALVLSAPSYAFFGFGSSDDEDKSTDMSALTGQISQQLNTAQSTPLTDMISSQLDVSPTQAAGGAGALLSLAQTQLSDENSSELSSLIPGLNNFTGSTGLTSMITNMDSVKSTFEGLGIDPALVTQFAPVILQYLTSEGASSNLLGSLGSLWGA